MKVLVLANSDIGLYKFRRELLCELLKENDVYVSVPKGEYTVFLERLGCKIIETPIDRRGNNIIKDLNLLKKYFSLIKKIKPDFVITYTIKPNIYGSMVCRLKRIPYFVNITGLGTSFEKNGMLKWMVTELYRISIKKANMVFFENSEIMKRFVSENIISKDKTKQLMGAGVNIDYFQYQEYPNNSVCKFLFIGRVMKEKGIEELLDSMKLLISEGNYCHLDVVGPLEEDYEKILLQYEKEGWLEYHGFQDDVREFLKECDCFVLPSYHEGMANTNLEAAATGRPIITSNISGCKEAVVEGSGILCKPQDTDSLYKALKRMIELNNREEMGRIGRVHIEKMFNKVKVVNETIQSINENLPKR